MSDHQLTECWSEVADLSLTLKLKASLTSLCCRGNTIRKTTYGLYATVLYSSAKIFEGYSTPYWLKADLQVSDHQLAECWSEVADLSLNLKLKVGLTSLCFRDNTIRKTTYGLYATVLYSSARIFEGVLNSLLLFYGHSCCNFQVEDLNFRRIFKKSVTTSNLQFGNSNSVILRTRRRIFARRTYDASGHRTLKLSFPIARKRYSTASYSVILQKKNSLIYALSSSNFVTAVFKNWGNRWELPWRRRFAFRLRRHLRATWNAIFERFRRRIQEFAVTERSPND